MIAVLERNAEKIILSGISAQYTGRDVLNRIQKVSPVFKILSRKRGRVGILVPNSPGAAMAILTTIALGRIPVILDASLRRERIEKMLPKMNLDFLIVSAAAYPELATPCSTIRVNMAGGVVNFDPRRVQWGSANLPRQGTAVILYTSGSSGEPKGVQLSGAGISYTVDTLIERFQLSEHSISTCVLPLCHTMGLNTQFLPTFFAGGSCVFHQSSLSLRKIYRRIIDSKGTFVGLISELVQFCYDEKIRRDLAPATLVEHVQIAGGIIREDHLRMARELFPNAKIHKGYGQTEAIRIAMIASDDPGFLRDTAGYPLPGQRIEIRDSEGKVLGPGEIGEIHVNGPNVMLGYDNSVDMPKIQEGFLNTGDLGYLDESGAISIHGRADSIFKMKGERVSGREIESAVRAVGEDFRDVKCLPVECDARGVRPVLFVEMPLERAARFLREKKTAFERELKSKLNDSMKIPKDVFILTRFPRTTNGKIRHGSLIGLSARRDRLSDLGVDALGFQFFMVPDELLDDDGGHDLGSAAGSHIA